jgi:geranylgeranyl diphosphate synthase type I
MLAAELVKKGSSDSVIPAALALEVTHTFTLVHDDIMDGDAVRRGVPTVHKKWDEPTAILAGDVLYAEAFELITMADAEPMAKVEAVAILARTCLEICRGQHEDMSFEKRDDVDPYEYLEMVGQKTGKLYAAAAAIGGILAGGDAQQVAALHDWGYLSGVAFQIQDDVIDFMADSAKSGKDRASDLREGKQTLVAIFAKEKGVDLSKYKRESLSDDEVDRAIAELNEAGIIDAVRETAMDHVRRARETLIVFPECNERRLLGEITDYFINRSF